MIACAASGSSSSINSVEPLISANSAVTVLRSPSRISPPGGPALTRIPLASSLTGCFGPAADPNEVPHSWQNFALAGLAKPHFGQRPLNDSPHSMQNFAPTAFSALHLEQVTRPSLLVRRAALGVLEVGRIEAFGEPAVDVRE